MRVDLVFSPQGLVSGSLPQRTVVVIDVIRASTTITTALAHGARAVVPCATPEEARALSQGFPPGEALLGGERRATAPQGFHLGNSPGEYTEERVGGRTILFTTSNGTRALLAARGASAVGMAGFINVSAAARWAMGAGRDLLIVCAGKLGGFSLEDAVCGGMVIRRLQESGADLILGNEAWAASLLFRHYEERVGKACDDSEWGQELRRRGFGADLDVCAGVDHVAAVPVLSGDRLGLIRIP